VDTERRHRFIREIMGKLAQWVEKNKYSRNNAEFVNIEDVN
jgi:hypothetical protein